MQRSIEFLNILPFVLYFAFSSNSFTFNCCILLFICHALIRKWNNRLMKMVRHQVKKCDKCLHHQNSPYKSFRRRGAPDLEDGSCSYYLYIIAFVWSCMHCFGCHVSNCSSVVGNLAHYTTRISIINESSSQ